jgi:hypothetical protein
MVRFWLLEMEKLHFWRKVGVDLRFKIIYLEKRKTASTL